MRFRGFEEVSSDFLLHSEVKTALPRRADFRSAGYDFYSKETIILAPNQQHTFFTDVRAYMQSMEMLDLYIRSSLATKKGLVLVNQTGIVDSSYYKNPDNDGNIGICIKNTSDNNVEIKIGDRIAQGIFTNYLITDDDEPIANERLGGFGSTGR